MLLRPVRTLVLLLCAYVAGTLFERAKARDLCLDRGGTPSSGICMPGDD